jgi:bacterioferritin
VVNIYPGLRHISFAGSFIGARRRLDNKKIQFCESRQQWPSVVELPPLAVDLGAAAFCLCSKNREISQMAETREEIVKLLTMAYCMELETVMNYIANSINLDGVRAEEIKKSLAADIAEELGHAQMLGNRIKQLGGLIPGSKSVELGRQTQPSSDTTDVVAAIQAVISAEEAACAHYKKIIKATDGEDYVTQDLCIRLLADEEEHLVLFKGFMKEYAK